MTSKQPTGGDPDGSHIYARCQEHVIPIGQSAERGEVIYIGVYGKAQAKLVPITAGKKPKKRIGLLKGKLVVPDDFDAPLSDDIIAEFEK